MAHIVHLLTAYLATLMYGLAIMSGFRAMRAMADEADFDFGHVMSILIDYFENLVTGDNLWIPGSRAKSGHIAWMALAFGMLASFTDMFLLIGNKILTDNAEQQGIWVSTLWNAGHIAAALGLLFLHIWLHAKYARKA